MPAGAKIRDSRSLGLRGNVFINGVDTVTLTTDLVMAFGDKLVQFIDPGGSNQTIKLPPEQDGMLYILVNTADAAENLTVQEDAGSTTIAQVQRNEMALFVSDGTAWRALVGSKYGGALADDVYHTFGTDDDAVIGLSSAAVGVDVEVINHYSATGYVIEGTSDHLGHAANSLVISNLTNNGDIHILVSKAGNSHTAFLADGSTGDTILNASSGQSVDLYIAGTKEVDYATGALAFQQATTVSTTAGDLSISAANDILFKQGASTIGGFQPNTGGADYFNVHGITSGTETAIWLNSVAGQNTKIYFVEGGVWKYFVYYDAGNNRFAIQSEDVDGGGTNADIIRILDGQLSVDFNTTADENQFDDYDDVAVLSAAYSPTADAYDLGHGLLKRGRELLADIGILRRHDDGWLGYNDQRMAALLAGGIYQTRDHINALQSRIEAIENRIGIGGG